MECEKIELILKKYFTIFILSFLLFSTYFLVLFDFSIYYLKDMPRSHFSFLSLLFFIFYLIVFIAIIELLKKEEEKWK